MLRRASFSPNIKERADFSCALFTAAGDLLVQAENIPVHLGSMPASVAVAVERFGPTIRPGQQVLLNDPFDGGTHLNDLTLVLPCFAGGEGALVGWAANRAHHADVGGSAPGSLPADATEVFQEGLRIPPVLLTPEVRAILAANSRTPEERRGDLDAQVGANRVGAERLVEVLAAVGGPEVLGEVLDYGERRVRAALAGLPEGRWHFADVIDSTGARPDQQVPADVVVTVSTTGSGICFDFTGSSSQRAGNVNAPEAVTRSAVDWALRTAVDPGLPANAGALRPVQVVVPPGSILAARPPAAVGAGNVEVSQRVADVCLGALAQALPERVGAASQGHDEQPAPGRGRLGVLRDRGRRPGRPTGPGRDVRRAHGHDQYQEHAGGGVRAGLPAASAAAATVERQRRGRRSSGRRRRRTGHRAARAGHAVVDHRAAGVPTLGPAGRRARPPGGELAVARR